jgi:hypothetical protein
LATEEMLTTMTKIVANLDVDEEGCKANLAKFGAFSASERVLMALVAAGADRQVMHEKIRTHSLKAWDAVRGGKSNPLADYLAPPTVENPRVDGCQGVCGHRSGKGPGDGGNDPRGVGRFFRKEIISPFNPSLNGEVRVFVEPFIHNRANFS